MSDREAHADALDLDGRLGGSLFRILGFIGFSLYLGWTFSLLFGPVLLSQLELGLSERDIEILRGIMLFTVSLTLLVCGKLRSRFLSWRSEFAIGICVLICGPLVSLAVLFQTIIDNWMLAAAWILGGASYGLLQVLWSSFLVRIGRQESLAFSSGMMATGAAIFTLTSYLQVVPAAIVLSLMPVLSVVLCLTIVRGFWDKYGGPIVVVPHVEHKCHKSIQTIDAVTKKIYRDEWLFTLIYSVGFGIAIYCSMVPAVHVTNIVVVGTAIGLANLLVLVLSLNKVNFSSEKIVKYFLPLSALGLFPMLFTNAWGRLICSAFLIFIYMGYGAINLGLLVRIGSYSQVNSVSLFSYGRFGNTFGVLLGCVFGYLAFGLQPDNFAVSTVIVATVILAFILANNFVLENTIISMWDSLPLNSENEAISDFSIPQSRRIRFHEERCRLLAKEYGLTPRQTEVLSVLGKGRNVRYISEHFVVSEHTAKAHVYTIYKKMGVHSQQELMDRVDGVIIPEGDLKR